MPELKTIFTGDATPLQRELKNIPRMTEKAMRDLRGTLETHFKIGRVTGNAKNTLFNPVQQKDAVRDYANWWDKAIKERAATEKAARLASLDAAMAEMDRRRAMVAKSRKEYIDDINARSKAERQAMVASRGFGVFGRMGAASRMFISAGRDTLTSLASGAPTAQVIAQQAPQVLQAFSMIGLSLKTLGLAGLAAGAALFTLKSASEAYQAKLRQTQSEGDLYSSQGANRQRLRNLLSEYGFRMNPGESESLGKELTRAFVAYSNDPNAENTANLQDVESKIRERLREVILTDQQKSNLGELGQMMSDNIINAMPEGREKDIAAENKRFTQEQEKIKELSKGLSSPADLAVINDTYRTSREAHEQKIKDINAKFEKKDSPATRQRTPRAADANELQRIGGMAVGNLQMLDIARGQLARLTSIDHKLSRGTRGVNFGGR